MICVWQWPDGGRYPLLCLRSSQYVMTAKHLAVLLQYFTDRLTWCNVACGPRPGCYCVPDKCSTAPSAIARLSRPPKFSVALNLLRCTNHCQIRSSGSSVHLFFHNRFSEGLWCGTKVIRQRLEKFFTYSRPNQPADVWTLQRLKTHRLLCCATCSAAVRHRVAVCLRTQINWIKTGTNVEVMSSSRRTARLRHSALWLRGNIANILESKYEAGGCELSGESLLVAISPTWHAWVNNNSNNNNNSVDIY